MEKFYLEEPSLERENEAIQYISEHNEFNSNINGTGSLDKYFDNYEGWLEKLQNDYNNPPEGKVPSKTYFLIRENDNKIIGMINIRLKLNERLSISGGHIGYGIRPTERQKGYNKINLYLGLVVCDEHGIENAMLTADVDNPASWKTMEALGGHCKEETIDPFDGEMIKNYEINVKDSLEKNKDVYEKYISEKGGIYEKNNRR